MMKAITCPQCGALIKRISLKDKFAFCDYCGAKILLEENKIVELPAKKEEKKLTPWEQYRENYGKVQARADQYYVPDLEPPTRNYPLVGALIMVAIVVIPLIIFIASLDNSTSDQKKIPKKTLVENNNSFMPRTPTRTPTPYPKINYEVKVQWNGDNDMEHFENPQIDQSKLPSFDETELKKTVFKNRGVQVKITIDTTGEVTAAEAISGHLILKEAAQEAAIKNLFNPRQKPTKRILTYYFRLITD